MNTPLDQMISQALGATYTGDHHTALTVSQRAAHQAEQLGDLDAQVRAMTIHGRTAVYSEDDAERGLGWLARAAELSSAAVVTPETHAESLREWGGALTFAELPERASAVLKQALDACRRAYGPDAPTLAKVYGSLSGAHRQADDYAGSQKWLQQGLQLLASHLGPDSKLGEDDRGEALNDHLVLLYNLTDLLVIQERSHEALVALEHTLDALSVFQEEGHEPPAGLIDRLLTVAEGLAHFADANPSENGSRVADKLDALFGAASDQNEDEDEFDFWARVLAVAAQCQSSGLDDAQTAELLMCIARGDQDVPPALHGLCHDFQSRTERDPMFGTTFMMGMDLVRAGSDSLGSALQEQTELQTMRF